MRALVSDHPSRLPARSRRRARATCSTPARSTSCCVLSILSLTDEERREMRDADPRTREILERTESLSRDELMRLHGTIRELGPAPA